MSRRSRRPDVDVPTVPVEVDVPSAPDAAPAEMDEGGSDHSEPESDGDGRYPLFDSLSEEEFDDFYALVEDFTQLHSTNRVPGSEAHKWYKDWLDFWQDIIRSG